MHLKERSSNSTQLVHQSPKKARLFSTVTALEIRVDLTIDIVQQQIIRHERELKAHKA